MSDRVVKTIENVAGDRRVEIVRRANGTFGFQEWTYGANEAAWHLSGRYSFAITDTAERAELEARSRIGWLGADEDDHDDL